MSMTMKRKFHVRKQQKGRKELRQDENPEVPIGRVPRESGVRSSMADMHWRKQRRTWAALS